MTARQIALKDIADSMRAETVQVQDRNGDIWTVTANRIDTKEQRQLNAKLGLNKINYQGNKNAKL